MVLARTLSGRLLLLTVLIVMLAEVLVFMPSVARFRIDYLNERLRMAQIASLALLAAEDAMVEEALEAELLQNAEVSSIVLHRDSARQLVLQAPMGEMVRETVDLRDQSVLSAISDAMSALVRTKDSTIRVIGAPANHGGQVIEITMREMPLKREMIEFGWRILILSLFISTLTGFLVFFICRRLIVRPIQVVVQNLVAFQSDPEGAPVAAPGMSEIAEIRQAEIALREMQTEVRAALRQKSHLADLGAAVAKISHDMRNMLASAQLMADRLDGSDDPVVARIGPKLIRSLDRASDLCASTLRHGRAEETPPEPRRVSVTAQVEEVCEAIFPEAGDIMMVNQVTPDVEVMVDPDHLFRILANLARNARQAIEATGRTGRVTIAAKSTSDGVRITIGDDGPGMPAKALEHLFQPFRGGTRRDGSGLGLAIAAELAEANGGALSLVSSGPSGTIFCLMLPI